MLETLKARKEQLEAQGKKGFTLMEMLIVIAIIAILIAIAIPLFTSQLNNAKEAADEANARSIYAIVMADYMDNNKYDATLSANSLTGQGQITVTQDGATQTFEFSDQNAGLTINKPESGAPTVTYTGKSGTTHTFPDNPTGASSGSAQG